MNLELGRRAVACKAWRWRPGMLAEYPNAEVMRVGYKDHEGTDISSKTLDGLHDPGAPRDWPIPDLSDPATIGCLLALVREAYRAPTLVAVRLRGSGFSTWRLVVDNAMTWPNHPTEEYPDSGSTAGASEVEALVAALEAAP